MNEVSKRVMDRLKDRATCDCCGMRVKSDASRYFEVVDNAKYGELTLCQNCRRKAEPILEQGIELRRAPLDSEKLVEGSQFTRAWTLGTRYDANCIAVSTGDIQDCRIDGNELLKVLQKHKFKAVKSRKYFYLEVLDG